MKKEPTMNKLSFPRESYYPKGATIIRDKSSTAVIAAYETAGKLFACMFHGKANKPDSHYRYKSAESRATAIQGHLDNIRAREALMVTRRTERKQADRGVNVGDVLLCSWGYDQTNIDYYEVTALIGSRMVEIREIGCETIDTAWMQGKSVPAKGQYIGKPMRKVAKNGSVRITSYSTASKMTPTIIAGVEVYSASHWTAYA